MNIELKLNKDFERFFDKLKEEYGDDFLNLNGLNDEKLSPTNFLDEFVKAQTVADASVDGSANVGQKDIVTLRSEKNKPQEKLLAYFKIFLEYKQKYGLVAAKHWLELEWIKALYMHDANTANMIPYCFAYDLTKLAEEGLFNLPDHRQPEPAQHLETFVDFVKEFISFTSNRTSGACGLPNLIPYMYYFWKKDCENGIHGLKVIDPERFAKAEIQRLIYAMNQPYTRDGIQSAFINTSIFDSEYFDALFGGMIFPDETLAIDEKDGIMQFQKWFMEEMKTIKDNGRMFTFPVNTISLLKKDGKFVDEDFAKWASHQNRFWNDSNFFCDDSVNSLSNCPVAPDTKILYWSDYYNEFKLSPIKEVYWNKCQNSGNKPIKVLANSNIVKCKINKFDEPANYLITLTNGATLRTTSGHLNKVYNKDYIPTKDLTTEDYLPFSTKVFKSNDFLSYEEGKLVGMFLGDGSYCNSTEIVFSLNKDTDCDDIKFIEEYCPKKFGAKITYSNCKSQLTGKETCQNIGVNSSYLKGLINQFVIGDSAKTKALSLKVLNCSESFRRGIIDGIYTTDGNKSSEDCNRIYTSSEKLKDSLIVLFSSLGLVTKIYVDKREGRLGNDLCYTIRWFTPNGRSKRKDSYIVDDNYMWIKIKSIEKISGAVGVSYCLEVLDKNAPEEFMLGNGIITHNCRLKSNIADLGYFNSIGGSGLRVGSVKVSTINFARIAYESGKNEDKFLEILKDRIITNLQALDVVRDIIKKNVQRGLLPNFNEGMIDFEHLYNTCGINGIYETMKFFGYTEVDEFGYTKYKPEAFDFGKKILEFCQKTSAEFAKDKDYKVNWEQVPAESAAVKFQKADKMLFGEMFCNVGHECSGEFYHFTLNNKEYCVPSNDKIIDDYTIKEIINEDININLEDISKYIVK